LQSSSLKLGGDISVAVGPYGEGAQAATANVSADILAFAKSKGLFAGIDVNGAVIKTRNDWNRAYYGKDVTPRDILVLHAAHNRHSRQLLAAVSMYTCGREVCSLAAGRQTSRRE